jgi:hypothetical protein
VQQALLVLKEFKVKLARLVQLVQQVQLAQLVRRARLEIKAQ